MQVVGALQIYFGPSHQVWGKSEEQKNPSAFSEASAFFFGDLVSALGNGALSLYVAISLSKVLSIVARPSLLIYPSVSTPLSVKSFVKLAIFCCFAIAVIAKFLTSAPNEAGVVVVGRPLGSSTT